MVKWLFLKCILIILILKKVNISSQVSLRKSGGNNLITYKKNNKLSKQKIPLKIEDIKCSGVQFTFYYSLIMCKRKEILFTKFCKITFKNVYNDQQVFMKMHFMQSIIQYLIYICAKPVPCCPRSRCG